MGKAVAYISIEHTHEDVIDPPAGSTACNVPKDRYILREGQLCWGVQEGGVNPMRVDIYSGEKQPLAFGWAHEENIEIYSEKCRAPARMFLKRRAYFGTLKIVCLDCKAKEFKFRLDVDQKEPIEFLPKV
jgi:hypothetical protein